MDHSRGEKFRFTRGFDRRFHAICGVTNVVTSFSIIGLHRVKSIADRVLTSKFLNQLIFRLQLYLSLYDHVSEGSAFVDSDWACIRFAL